VQYTLAAVQIFSDADQEVFAESYGTLHICKYLGRNGIRIIDAKWITDVVGMVPFKFVCGEMGYAEGKQYFAVEKMSAVLIGRSDGDEDGDYADHDQEE
jgi:hypothetical protein